MIKKKWMHSVYVQQRLHLKKKRLKTARIQVTSRSSNAYPLKVHSVLFGLQDFCFDKERVVYFWI